MAPGLTFATVLAPSKGLDMIRLLAFPMRFWYRTNEFCFFRMCDLHALLLHDIIQNSL
jgi:hypothetical protein